MRAGAVAAHLPGNDGRSALIRPSGPPSPKGGKALAEAAPPLGKALVEVHHGRKISDHHQGHDGAAGDTDTVELMTRGSLVHKDGAYYIVYKETETTGYEGCTTTVKVADDARKVSMLRYGKQSSQLIIEGHPPSLPL